ncbi:MAG: hypothetical protein WC880_00835 [Candidatus Paceibacterota bacterium]
MKGFLRTGIATVVAFAPFAAFADVGNALGRIGDLISQATPIVVALALLAFFWGLVTYIFGSSNDEKRKKGIHIMVWGIIALFVMLSVFGIINALQSTLGVQNTQISIPKVTPDVDGGGTVGI